MFTGKFWGVKLAGGSVVTVVESFSVQLKSNRLSHFDEHPKNMFHYLVKLFDVKVSKVGHNFTKYIF